MQIVSTEVTYSFRITTVNSNTCAVFW